VRHVLRTLREKKRNLRTSVRLVVDLGEDAQRNTKKEKKEEKGKKKEVGYWVASVPSRVKGEAVVADFSLELADKEEN